MNALDGERIDATNSPGAIAERFLNVVEADHLAPLALEMLAGGENGWENEAHIAGDVAVAPSNCWSEVAVALAHRTDGSRFAWLADMMLAGCHRRAEHSIEGRVAQTAATVGFNLARHTAEADLARAVGGTVAPASREGEAVDVLANGHTVQVLTSGADSPRTANEKMSADERERIDFYVVLHIKNDGTFGVGVNDMREDDQTPRGESAAAKAVRA